LSVVLFLERRLVDSLPGLEIGVSLLLILLPFSALPRLGIPECAVTFCFRAMEFLLDGFETGPELGVARILFVPLLFLQIKVLELLSERGSSGPLPSMVVSFVLYRILL